jgi:hypothetical protein
VVDCSGLENLAGKSPETAETVDLCGSHPAQDATFTGRSARRDGAKVGTPADALAMLIVAIEWECPPIIDGVDVERRARILLRCAKEVRSALPCDSEI